MDVVSPHQSNALLVLTPESLEWQSYSLRTMIDFLQSTIKYELFDIDRFKFC